MLLKYEARLISKMHTVQFRPYGSHGRVQLFSAWINNPVVPYTYTSQTWCTSTMHMHTFTGPTVRYTFQITSGWYFNNAHSAINWFLLSYNVDHRESWGKYAILRYRPLRFFTPAIQQYSITARAWYGKFEISTYNATTALPLVTPALLRYRTICT